MCALFINSSFNASAAGYGLSSAVRGRSLLAAEGPRIAARQPVWLRDANAVAVTAGVADRCRSDDAAPVLGRDGGADVERGGAARHQMRYISARALIPLHVIDVACGDLGNSA